MTSSYTLVQSLLSDLLQAIFEEEASNSSLKLSFSGTPDHPLPCSEDFQFFFSISTTVPPHSPDGISSTTFSGITPPHSPTPPSSLCPTQVQVSRPPSPGVSLLPLSGQMTQAPPPTFPQQEDTVQTSIGLEEEPASKRVKWELEEEVDLLDDEQDTVVELDDDDDTDDDLLPLPLTFNTSADLMWKLQKADILPARSVLPSQRPVVGRVGTDQVSTAEEELDEVKKERKEEDQVAEDDDDTAGDDLCTVEDGDEDCYVTADCEENGPQKAVKLYRPSMAKLLNRPPRLGLSKLDRKINNLHDVSIIEKEE